MSWKIGRVALSDLAFEQDCALVDLVRGCAPVDWVLSDWVLSGWVLVVDCNFAGSRLDSDTSEGGNLCGQLK